MLFTKKQTVINIISASILILVISTNNAIASDVLSPWVNSQPLPYPIANQTAFISNNTINIIAGSTTTTTSNIAYSKIDNEGNLSQWNYSNNFPSAIYWHTLSKKDNYIYVIGGATYPPANSVNSVYRGTVVDGSLTSWTQLNPLPEPSSMGNTIITGNKIYFLGGYNMVNGSYNSFSNKVFMTNILDDGSIGQWTQTLQLPKSIFGFGTITINNKIITLGGRDQSNTSISTIYQANIQPNGSIDSWIEIGNLPQAITNAQVARANNTIFVIGGANINSSGQVNWLNTVYYATIDDNGNIGEWKTSQYLLPKTICCGSVVTSDTHLYLIGGYDGKSGSYINDVYKTVTQDINTPLLSLDVPDIKQYTAPWNNQIYDHADTWATNPTIQRWGCALTSASMILNYYGYSTDPETLNIWLNNQQDGYIRNGLVNWLAISRYTKINSDGTKPSLEYTRLANNNNNLINELKNNRPAILEEPGHYVVAKSQTKNSFGINDPGFTNKLTLDSYNNNFLSIGAYTPSYTDLSYIMLVLDQNVDIKIYDDQDNEVKNTTFIQNPLMDDLDFTDTTNQTLKIVLLPKPNQNNYLIQISGNGSYQLESYIYDQNGNNKYNNFIGLVNQNNPDFLKITIGEKDKLITQLITIDSIIKDWENLSFKYNPITTLLTNSKKLIYKGNNYAAKSTLKATSLYFQNQISKSVDYRTSQALQTEISTLSNSL